MPPLLEPLRIKKPRLPLSGVSEYTKHFAEAGDTNHKPPPPPTRPADPRLFLNPEYALQVSLDLPNRIEKRVSKKKLALERRKAIDEAATTFDAAEDPNIQGDPLKTLFVARLPYDITERQLRNEFEEYGPIKRISIVHHRQSAKPRGYAFIEYDHKSDMKEAYKSADGAKFGDRKCLVDVERGRSVPNWVPRRLGGGKKSATTGRTLTRLPRDVGKQRIRKLIDSLAGWTESNGYEKPLSTTTTTLGGGGGAMNIDRDRGRRDRDRDRDRERDRERERERDRERDRREREREQDRYRERERERDRSSRKRDRGYYEGRDRDRDRSRDRDRDYHRGDRERGRYEEVEEGEEGYHRVPPPGHRASPPPPLRPPLPPMEVVSMDDDGDDEPEEGEFLDEGEVGEPDAKRAR